MLELSRSTRGELLRSEVDIAELAQRIHWQFQRENPGRTVALETAGPLRIRADPRLLATLLQNAWKYSARRPTARIVVEGGELDGEPLICIADDGAGFDPALAHRLFEPFQRLHARNEFPGIGIGLATAARIVQRHGGVIEGCGRPGGGARFCFTLGAQ